MRIIRSIVWIVLLAALLVFTANNWRPVELKVWEGLVLETKIPALAIIAFIAGFLPMWLMHRGRVWQLQRRIGVLENAARSAAASLAMASPEPASALTENENPPHSDNLTGDAAPAADKETS